LDPDQNYYNPIMNQRLLACKYYHPDQLATDLQNKEKIQLSIFCMNIRSMRKFFTGLNTLLDIIDSDFHILSFTETWLREYNIDQFNIEGYTHEAQIREDKEGGGISLYIQTKLSYKTRDDLNHNSNDCQFLWVEIDKRDLNTDTNVVVGVIYRRPGSDVNIFNEILDNRLLIIKNEKKECYHRDD
jgi:exonuclease III